MKNNFKIDVQVTFIKEQSHISNNQFIFAYTITMTNNGTIGAQLLHRHWIIKDETGHVEEVAGKGVAGQQPYIMPGESYQYSSGSIIKTAVGTMKGSYNMINDENEHFEVKIAEFILSEPYVLH